MAQIFSLEKEKIKLCDSVVDKSNKVKLLVVKDPAKNIESVHNEQLDKINFQLFNNYDKINIKNKLKVVLNNCLQVGKAIQK